MINDDVVTLAGPPAKPKPPPPAGKLTELVPMPPQKAAIEIPHLAPHPHQAPTQLDVNIHTPKGEAPPQPKPAKKPPPEPKELPVPPKPKKSPPPQPGDLQEPRAPLPIQDTPSKGKVPPFKNPPGPQPKPIERPPGLSVIPDAPPPAKTKTPPS